MEKSWVGATYQQVRTAEAEMVGYAHLTEGAEGFDTKDLQEAKALLRELDH